MRPGKKNSWKKNRIELIEWSQYPRSIIDLFFVKILIDYS
jgi:hypothetical protein